MLKALWYCHKVVKIIHRDIKPENILINHNYQAVLIDFGVSTILKTENDVKMKGKLGSTLFHAPEMFLVK